VVFGGGNYVEITWKLRGNYGEITEITEITGMRFQQVGSKCMQIISGFVVQTTNTIPNKKNDLSITNINGYDQMI
jgi:hypothetical protein